MSSPRLASLAVYRSQATVLVVDDDADNREILSELLALENVHVVTAHDGREALDIFGDAKPDVVLLDVQMPRMNGFELCRTLKANPETRLVPIVLVTALAAVSDRVRGIEAGADDFITKPLERTQLIARVRSLLSLKNFTDELERAETVLFALARSIEAKDPYTQGHCERLSHYSVELAQAVGLNEEEQTALRRAGIVHDIGKVAVPDAVLLKPGRLTAEELAIMQRHPILGEQICAPLKSFAKVLPVIRSHHEKRDGSGYPDGLEGDAIPLTARVLQIVDVYDALTTVRPYKAALSQAETLATMEGEVKKGWWDPEIFATFATQILKQGWQQPA